MRKKIIFITLSIVVLFQQIVFADNNELKDNANYQYAVTYVQRVLDNYGWKLKKVSEFDAKKFTLSLRDSNAKFIFYEFALDEFDPNYISIGKNALYYSLILNIRGGAARVYTKIQKDVFEVPKTGYSNKVTILGLPKDEPMLNRIGLAFRDLINLCGGDSGSRGY